MIEGSGATPKTNQPKEEAQLMFGIRKVHSKALRNAASKLQSKVFEKHVQPIKGMVDIDVAALAAKMVMRVVERSEEGFERLCDRMAVNEKLLDLERRRQRAESAIANGTESPGEQGDFVLRNVISPLPSDRQPVELVREITMSLKQAERDRLLALAEEAERQADAEAATMAQIEMALEKKLAEVAETQEALTEAARSLP